MQQCELQYCIYKFLLVRVQYLSWLVEIYEEERNEIQNKL